jgi:hypothetical protein
MHRWNPVNESFHTVCVIFENRAAAGVAKPVTWNQRKGRAACRRVVPFLTVKNPAFALFSRRFRVVHFS